ncbi:MAG: hypothetical protein ACI9F2_001106, partial [Lysobacterales bacterium]
KLNKAVSAIEQRPEPITTPKNNNTIIIITSY